MEGSNLATSRDYLVGKVTKSQKVQQENGGLEIHRTDALPPARGENRTTSNFATN